MKKNLNYILVVIGILFLIFFCSYNGSAIPLKALWIVLSFFIALSGFYLIAKEKLKTNRSQNFNSNNITQIGELKKNGEKIRITLDNAEVKSRSYQSEINNEFPTQTQMLDALYDGNKNYQTKEIIQTYIVFYKDYKNKTYKFISPTTSKQPEILREIIDRDGVDLYIDKNNPNNYYFDTYFI